LEFEAETQSSWTSVLTTHFRAVKYDVFQCCSLNMLSVGVDRVVDQVINPKIHKDFKPLIDRVVCELMNIDYDQWIAKQSKFVFYLEFLRYHFCLRLLNASLSQTYLIVGILFHIWNLCCCRNFSVLSMPKLRGVSGASS
jgi:hypothetical protein